MRLNTPSFWYKRHSIPADLLMPAAWLYGLAAAKLSGLAKPYRSTIPVICCGNIVAGGSGKTPAAIALMALVKSQEAAKNPCFLTRGYGGRAKETPLYVEDHHTAKDVGDEAMLLRRHAPVIISPDRGKGAKLAEERGFDLIIMDDGLQNGTLQRDVSFLVIDGATGFGNGRLLPAGPLREPPETGIKKIQACLIIGDDQAGVRQKIPGDIPVFHAAITREPLWIADTKSRYIAFCGLGHPQKFKKTLDQQHIKTIEFISYPDHYGFSASDLDTLAAKARHKKARLITTEKDAVRIPEQFVKENPVDILPVIMVWRDPQKIAAFLKKIVKDTRRHKNAQE